MLHEFGIETYEEMQTRLKEAFTEIEELKSRLGKQMGRNSRGAGRKGRMTEEDRNRIPLLRSQGLSYCRIARELSLPVGTVFNYLKSYSATAGAASACLSEKVSGNAGNTAKVNEIPKESDAVKFVDKLMYREIMSHLTGR